MPPKRKIESISTDSTTSVVTSTTTTNGSNKAVKLDSDKDKDVFVNNNSINLNVSTPTKPTTPAPSPLTSPSHNTTTTTTTTTTTAVNGTIKAYPFINGTINMVKWIYKESEFEERVFPIDIQQLIEDLYVNNSKDTTEHKIQDNYFKFSDMTYYVGNSGTIKKKPIERLVSIAIWSWEKSRGIYDAFHPDLTKKIETSFLSGTSNYPIDTERYINFGTLEQIRFDDSTKKRKLSRTFVETIIDVPNPTWYYLTYDSAFSPIKWEIYPDTIEIEKSFQNFLNNGKAIQIKSSTNDNISFAPIQCFNQNKFNGAILKVKRSSGSPDIVPLTKKSYSQLSEEEKKDIIIKTLNGTLNNNSNNNNNSSITSSNNKVDSQMYLPGEEDIINGSDVMKYILRPCRQFSNSGADLHFRTAESQFYRLLQDNVSKYKVTKVEYIVNPKLIKSFNQKKEEFEKLKYPDCQPVFGFHGTSKKSIPLICKNNFSLAKIGSKTDSGYYGLGLYFSEYPEYSIDYISDCSKILLCKVLLGKSYKCTGLIIGQPCQTGYTSHLSPDEMELVIFNADQVLPLYIVHYDNGSTDAIDSYSSYTSASVLKSSSVLSGCKIVIIGTHSVTIAIMTKLIQNHGGQVVTKNATCTHMVCSRTEFNKRGTYVNDNLYANIPCISEEWIYQSIISKNIKNPSNYGYVFKQEKKISNDIKPIPLDQNDDDDDPKDESDEEIDEKPKPMCRYGNKCYRKNAQHFKEFAHEFLAD